MAPFLVGVLRETRNNDKRVSLTPDVIASLKNKHSDLFDFMVEEDAGKASSFSNQDYKEAGASIVERSHLLATSDVVLCFKRPEKDLETFRAIAPSSSVIGFLDPLKPGEHLDTLAQQNLTSLTLEFLPKTPKTASMDAFAAMGRLAGVVALDEALASVRSQLGLAKQPRVLVIGTGNAGMATIQKAIAYNCNVAVLATKESALETILNQPRHPYQKIDFLAHNPDKGSAPFFATLAKRFCPDIVICTARRLGQKAPLIIDGKGIEALPDNCRIEDLTASIGGNTVALNETDQKKQLTRGIVVHNRSNYPSLYPAEASTAYATCVENILSHVAANIARDQKLADFLATDPILNPALATHKGQRLIGTADTPDRTPSSPKSKRSGITPPTP